MSGYLAHLVERTIEPGPAIQPRLGTIFEPFTRARPAIAASIEEELPRDGDRSSTTNTTTNASPRRSHIQVEESVEHIPALRVNLSSDPPLLPVRASATHQAPSAPPARLRAADVSSPRTLCFHEPALEGTHETPPEPVQPSMDRGSSDSSTDSHGVSPASASPVLAPHTSIAPLPAAAIAAPALASQQPIVRVSIGRVEVRANVVAAPPASRPVAPQRSRLLLEEYLQSRSGGRR